MIRRTAALSTLVFVVLGTTLATATASSGASTAAIGSATFTDPAGDAQGGPDVTRVVVSGDAPAGSLSFTATAGSFDAAVTQGIEREIWVWLDTDSNGSTGDPEDGTEYGLVAWNDAEGKWWNILRWNGAAWESAPRSSAIRVTGQGDTVTWAVSTGDIGGATAFSFYVVADTWNAVSERVDARDVAPDVGRWSYDIAAPSTPTTPATPAAPKVNLLVGAPSSTPKNSHQNDAASLLKQTRQQPRARKASWISARRS